LANEIGGIMGTHEKTVLITGAAGGIGHDTALVFAERGANLVLLDLNSDAGNELAKKIHQLGRKALFIETDVSDEESVRVATETAAKHFGRIDVGFNNAGIELENAPLGDCLADTFDKVMRVNVRGVFLCMKYQIQQMLTQSGGGHIINTSSAAGLIAAPNRSVYTASKHAVLGLTKAAAVEYASKGLHINAICPGVVDTEMYRRAMAGNEELRTALEAKLPIGRPCSTTEIAYTVAWLSSEESRYIQGHALSVDGGVVAT
jgi:NAD(P)-dependent dehydrogenase (short-subunit alcohol dehydrogenase family)